MIQFSRYRPISLLSNIDKILKRLMHNRLHNFLEMNRVIYCFQFAFNILIHLNDITREQETFEIFVILQKNFGYRK